MTTVILQNITKGKKTKILSLQRSIGMGTFDRCGNLGKEKWLKNNNRLCMKKKFLLKQQSLLIKKVTPTYK